MKGPLSVQVHLGNPNKARIPELTIKNMPECEGGGWYMPVDEAKAITEVWNGFLVMTPQERNGLEPTWQALTAYWKERCEKAESMIENSQDKKC